MADINSYSYGPVPWPVADCSTINMRSYKTPSSFSFKLSGVCSSRRDSRSLQKNVRKAHHLTGPRLATVAEKYRERTDGRSKIPKKSIQMSLVTLSRSVAARLPFFRVKLLQPVKISRKNFRSAGAINSRLASVSSRGKPISILRHLPI